MDLSEHRVTATIAVSDLARARAFYEGKLGLKPANLRAVEDSERYACGHGTFILIFVSSNAGGSKNLVAGWHVRDLALMVEELASRGVTFFDQVEGSTVEGERRVPHVESGSRAAYFTDPDGNILGIKS
jgi:catechol 2,3-dioxygenase-like lactoylglutathione lyase family enzyme